MSIEISYSEDICVSVHLIVLQQYEAEVELWEGQLQVLYVSVFASLLLRQGKHRLPPPESPAVSRALPLGVQGGLQLILQCGESPLGLGQLFWRENRKEKKTTSKTEKPLMDNSQSYIETGDL